MLPALLILTAHLQLTLSSLQAVFKRENEQLALLYQNMEACKT